MSDQRRHNTDGRIARGERTREAIVAAHTALLREGVLKPTAKTIAERAGVSLRTVWLNFKDMEALFAETTAYWQMADLELREDIDPGLPLEDRIDAFCAQRARRLEHLAPAARSAALGEPFSPALAHSRQVHVERVESDLAATFRPELAARTDRDVLARALFVAASWPTWSSLRDDLGLDVDEAAAVVCHTLRVLLRT
ncbi:TetR/AcrR family transcriptional regulator [Aeromicrobium wangtongii]|uniref:TetR/AcrR family transcriptional regulator n=1 Tax=Aeromicrobium wangtongii TaxID=2969247 RepID=A0ABY5M6B9_9ACTN|nr:TetR/AcrR family transcriptional regulator [Aeromicrobium wangtongii]MCD9199357.1 TetR/AcrR family transcriptional regulator [Aeromicrobium wangtongii]UUP13715.1 TetR/AcrR family transcriptional regulator [Aeromicrobium wangtongii]